MGHREIRELLETEIKDRSELVSLLAVEQELHDYFSSQPSEAFRRQLKTQLLTDARKYRFLFRQNGRGWLYSISAIVAVAAVLLIAVTPSSLRQDWSTRLFGTGLVEQVAEAPPMLGIQDAIGNIAESSPETTGPGDEENSSISSSQNQEQGLLAGKVGGEGLLNPQPEFRVADSPAALADNGQGSPGSQGILESPEVLQQTPGLPEAASDFNNTGTKSLSRSRSSKPDTNVVINDPAFTPVAKVKVYKDQNRDWQSSDLQHLAAALGMDQVLTANSTGAGYSLAGNGKTLTVLTEKVPDRIQFTSQPNSQISMAGLAGPEIQQTEALSQAQKVLSALGYPDQGIKVVRQTETAAANYEFIFNLQAAGLTITDNEVRVEIDRRSGEVAEFAGMLPNFTELGEYSVISVEQALEKLWQAKITEAAVEPIGPLAAKSAAESIQGTLEEGKINQSMDLPTAAAKCPEVWSNLPIPQGEKLILEKIELIEEYELIDQQEALLIPRYRLSGQLTDGRHFEALVKAVE